MDLDCKLYQGCGYAQTRPGVTALALHGNSHSRHYISIVGVRKGDSQSKTQLNYSLYLTYIVTIMKDGRYGYGRCGIKIYLLENYAALLQGRGHSCNAVQSNHI